MEASLGSMQSASLTLHFLDRALRAQKHKPFWPRLASTHRALFRIVPTCERPGRRPSAGLARMVLRRSCELRPRPCSSTSPENKAMISILLIVSASLLALTVLPAVLLACALRLWGSRRFEAPTDDEDPRRALLAEFTEELRAIAGKAQAQCTCATPPQCA